MFDGVESSPSTFPVAVFITFVFAASASVTLCVKFTVALLPEVPNFVRFKVTSSSSAFGSATTTLCAMLPLFSTSTSYVITSPGT